MSADLVNLNDRPAKSLEDWKHEWDIGVTPFHRNEVHNTLKKYLPDLSKGKEKIKIFVPLCGKTWDMKWLYDLGHSVVGVEIASKAIENYFEEQGLEYITENVEKFTVYKTRDERIQIYCGDLYDFPSEAKNTFDAIWDKASFVAIEVQDREKYAILLGSLLKAEGAYLLQTIQYDPKVMSGPPRRLCQEDIEKYFGEKFDIQQMEQFDSLTERWKNKGHQYFMNVVNLMQPKKVVLLN